MPPPSCQSRDGRGGRRHSAPAPALGSVAASGPHAALPGGLTGMPRASVTRVVPGADVDRASTLHRPTCRQRFRTRRSRRARAATVDSVGDVSDGSIEAAARRAFAAALERGWSAGIPDALSLHVLGGFRRIETELAAEVLKLTTGPPAELFVPSVILMVSLCKLQEAGLLDKELLLPDGRLALTPAGVSASSMLRGTMWSVLHREKQLTVACDITLARVWDMGTVPAVPARINLELFSGPLQRSWLVELLERGAIRRCVGAHILELGVFAQAERYLVDAGLLSSRSGITDEGRYVMEELGGSIAEYRRHRRRAGATDRSGGGGHTTHISTDGGPAYVGSTGTMSGGVIRMDVSGG